MYTTWYNFLKAQRASNVCKPLYYFVIVKTLFNGKFNIVMFDSLDRLFELDTLSTLQTDLNLDIGGREWLLLQTFHLQHPFLAVTVHTWLTHVLQFHLLQSHGWFVEGDSTLLPICRWIWQFHFFINLVCVARDLSWSVLFVCFEIDIFQLRPF